MTPSPTVASSITTHPAPPWLLEGSTVVSPWLVSSRAARCRVPAPLQVIDVLPGLTLGAIFAASYLDSPVGGYDEFGFAPALVAYNGRWGFFVSHLYVDTRASAEAGRALWGLPKQPASIDWRQTGDGLAVEVLHHGQRVCRLESRQRGAAVPAAIGASFIARPEEGVRLAGLHLRARFAPASSRFYVAAGSPFEGLGLRLGLPSLWAWEARITVTAGEWLVQHSERPVASG